MSCGSNIKPTFYPYYYGYTRRYRYKPSKNPPLECTYAHKNHVDNCFECTWYNLCVRRGVIKDTCLKEIFDEEVRIRKAFDFPNKQN